MADLTIDKQGKTLTIDKTTHEIEKLEAKQRYLVTQLRDLESKIAAAKMHTDQLQMSKVTCANLLIDSFKESE
jgi:hypothetical protein|tara:strand:+ start:555 stop:773 length:219 start_codon:yes stop_codon:yes gene_type:complete